VIEAFLAACTILDATAAEKAAIIYSRFVAWCDQQKIEPLNQTAFGKLLTKRYEKRNLAEGIVYRGLRLIDD
jgi:hypothetical protein